MSNDKVFTDKVKNRYRLGTSLSAARFWSPKENITLLDHDDDGKEVEKDVDGLFVPRPDRNLGSLQNYALWGGFFGFDHFYLRSPATGIAKMLTLGGFGLWWLWDVVQTWTHENRVLNYGMVTPFDMWMNIGQGMIYKGDPKDWKYEQKTEFGTWMIAVIFGFTGLDMFLLGRFWLGFRKLMIFLIGYAALRSISEAGFFGMIWDLFVLTLFLAIVMIWFGDINKLFNNPQKIMTTGMTVPESAAQSLGWIRKLYEDTSGNIIGTPEYFDLKMKKAVRREKEEEGGPTEQEEALKGEWEILKAHYMFNPDGISPEELVNRFWIGYGTEHPVFKDDSSDKPNPGFPPVTLLLRIFGIMWDWIVSVCVSIFNFVKGMSPAGRAAMMAEKLQKDAAKAAAAAVAGGPAAAAGGLAGGLPGMPKLPAGLPGIPKLPAGLPKMFGGGREEPLSTEAQIMGATVIALVTGGSLKGLIDYLMAE